MTREEATIQSLLGHIKALEETIKALEQEPCEDYISRNDAINELNQSINLFEATDRLRELPSVTPTRKKGKWVDDEFGIRCSCCGIHTHLDKFDRPMKFKHCSMCGAEMESER